MATEKKQSNVPVITLDGPSGSGKGTIALALSSQLKWNLLNSGYIYRAMAFLAIKKNISPNEEAKILELVSKSGLSLSNLVNDMVIKYPSPGEINFRVKDPKARIEKVYNFFESSALMTDTTDGISMEFEKWRFNLRMSNTEPLVRLNLETRSDDQLLNKRLAEITFLIEDAS